MTQNISNVVSHHFRLLYFVAVVMVVYIHATTIKYSTTLTWDSSVGHLQSYLSHNLFHVALPIFFLNASFFLFLGQNITLSTLLNRQRRRIVSLAMPYLAWAALWYGLVKAYSLVTGTMSLNFEAGVLESLIISPLPGQMWFLRDLIVLVALSPLFLLIPIRLLISISIPVFVWWLWHQTPTVLTEREYWYEVLISNEALAWFLTGVILARVVGGNVLSAFLSHRRPKVLVLTFICWLVLPLISLPGELSHGLSIISGTLSLGLSLPWLKRLAVSKWVGSLSSYVFLIYLGHHPAISLLTAPMINQASESIIVHISVYLIMPFFIIIGIIFFFDLIQRMAPRVVFVLNGGRQLYPIISSGDLEHDKTT